MGSFQKVATILVAGCAGAGAAWRALRARDARGPAEPGADRLQTLNAAVRKAIHDLNNPLAAAAINAELLCATCPDDPNAQRLAKSIQDQIERTKEAVADLNQLVRPPEL